MDSKIKIGDIVKVKCGLYPILGSLCPATYKVIKIGEQLSYLRGGVCAPYIIEFTTRCILSVVPFDIHGNCGTQIFDVDEIYVEKVNNYKIKLV